MLWGRGPYSLPSSPRCRSPALLRALAPAWAQPCTGYDQGTQGDATGGSAAGCQMNQRCTITHPP
eukprot:6009800-Alexandrium_andersonii.AAC.1